MDTCPWIIIYGYLLIDIHAWILIHKLLLTPRVTPPSRPASQKRPKALTRHKHGAKACPKFLKPRGVNMEPKWRQDGVKAANKEEKEPVKTNGAKMVPGPPNKQNTWGIPSAQGGQNRIPLLSARSADKSNNKINARKKERGVPQVPPLILSEKLPACVVPSPLLKNSRSF